MSYQIEQIKDGQTLIGEGPHWDIATQSLYFVDVYGKKLMRFDYAQQAVYRSVIENDSSNPTFIIPIEGFADKFIVSLKNRVAIVVWDGVSDICKVEKYIHVVEETEEYKKNHLNDGKCDRRGRLFTGSMHDDFLKIFNMGNMYRLDKNDRKLLMSNIGLSNGIEFNYDTKKYYHVDSTGYIVREFDYDIETGEIKNPKIIFNNKDQQKDGKFIIPDGLTVDTEGYLYIAFFGGSNILKIDPKNGKVLLEIELPCEQVTSAAFGGPNLDILFVTTGALEGKPAPAGSTFIIKGLGAKGLPMSKYRLN